MADIQFDAKRFFKANAMPSIAGNMLVQGRSHFDSGVMNPRFHSVVVPNNPCSFDDYLQLFQRDVISQSVRTDDPRFIGHMTSALPDFLAELTKIVSGLNQNVVKLETSGAFTAYERQALGMLHSLIYGQGDDFYAQHLQNPNSTLGMMVSGGTLGNMAALWCARNRRFGPSENFAGIEQEGVAAALQFYGVRRAIIIGSSLMHYSLRKAVDLLGLGERNLVTLAPRCDGRIDPEQLRRVIDARQAEGDCVLAIVGIAGATETGSVDPLNSLADIAAEQGIHFHVDAAWGGPTLFSAQHGHLLAGIERADSVVIDGHKQLWLPMGTGMLLLKDPELARDIEKTANYIIRNDSADLGRRSIEGSRPATAVYLHAALNLLGRTGYAHLIDSGINNAQRMAQLITQHPAFELVSAPQLNILTYRYIPTDLRAIGQCFDATAQARIDDLNVRLQVLQRDKGESFVSRTRLFHTQHGTAIDVLRVVLANPLTSEADLLAVLTEQAELGLQLEFELLGLFQRFAAQVRLKPDAVALYDQNLAISYAALNADVEKIAQQLLQYGLKPKEIVAIAMQRSQAYVATLLAVIKLGGCFMPLDPHYPQQHLLYMLQDSQASLVIADAAGQHALAGWAGQCLGVDHLLANNDSAVVAVPAVQSTDETPLYIIYTSGSTGAAKGVIGLHGATLNRFKWMWQAFPYTENEVACQKTSPSFVDSIWEILGPLLAGVPSLIVPEDAVADPHAMVDVLAQYQVTRLVLVPTLLRRLLNAVPNLGTRLPRLTHWTLSGEVASRDLALSLRAAHSHASLLNLYGSSEVAADVSFWLLSPDMPMPNQATLPIGKPISNIQIYLLDAQGYPVAEGDIGEVYVSGAGLAAGYLHQPELTAERFVFLAKDPSVRAYRMGDLARYLPDGELEFIGRVDQQLKIRGVRIEPQQVERALREHPAVADALVVAAHHGNSTEPLLQAYVIKKVNAKVMPSELRKALAEQLVPAAVPSVYVFLDAFPLTPSGKLARSALPVAITGAAFPESGLERQLAEWMAEELGIASCGADDDFFALGGTSLTVIGFASRLAGKVSPRLIFDNSTPATLARALTAQEVTPASIHPAVQDAERDLQLRCDHHLALAAKPETLLMTGATGFFGAFLLHALQAAELKKIYCLVRAGDSESAKQRIEANLLQYGLTVVLPIEFLVGDLHLPKLGLNESDYLRLANEVDCIIHNAAQVNFIAPYSHLAAVNVQGTEAVIEFAAIGKVKAIHAISSLAVVDTPATARKMVDEQFIAKASSLPLTGYAQSKWVTEQRLLQASRAGIPVTIYRCDDLAGDSTTGHWNRTDLTWLWLKACTAVNAAPNIDVPWAAVPVDIAAQAVLALLMSQPCSGKAWHISSSRPQSWMQILDALAKQGFDLPRVSFADWSDALTKSSSPSARTLALLVSDALQGGKSYIEHLQSEHRPFYCQQHSEHTLDPLAVPARRIDDEVMTVYAAVWAKALSGKQ